MKFPLPHAAATALTLLMATGVAGAAPRPLVPMEAVAPDMPVLLAQADGDAAEQPSEQVEETLRKRAQERREERRKNRQAEAEKAAEEQARPRRQSQPQAEEKQPAAEQEPRRNRAEEKRLQRETRQKRETEAENAAGQGAEQAAPPESKPNKEQQRRKPKQETPDEPAAADAQAPDAGAAKPDDTTQKPPKKQRAEDKKQKADPQAGTGQEAEAPKRRQDKAAEGAESTEPEGTTREQRRQRREQAEQGAEQPDKPRAEERRERREKRREAEAKAPNDGAAAPVLDSQKQEQAEPRDRNKEAGKQDVKDGQDRKPPRQQEQKQAGPPPKSDREAQQALRPERIQPVIAEEGRRRELPDDPRRWERPQGSRVVREIDNRVSGQIDDRVIVESSDRPRMTRGARDVFYEDLRNGRVRETIVRRDGSRVVTVRNRYGDVIRRSRIMPDNREVVLVYVDERDFDRVRDWRDPGYYLPPMRLDIPVNEYILEAGVTNDVQAYYDFLDQPPVERVERLYSVDEVKRSARIRDKTRRIDLDTLTFEFGSAAIPEDQIARLESVADAMSRILDENPAETFLLEGHTDAVGSDLANLALSDRRAEAVADALTDFFDIPPENLATQGYGEEFLKVRTQAPERENRRVAIRRITPLVAPVASAE